MRVKLMIYKYDNKYYVRHIFSDDAGYMPPGFEEIFSIERDLEDVNNLYNTLSTEAKKEARKRGISHVIGLDN